MASNLLEAARRYHAAGFSLIPCTFKQPAVKPWQEYQVRRPTLREINQWFEEDRPGQSMALVLGKVSHNVVVVDLDGWASVRTFQIHFPAWSNTYTVLSGSQEGLHLYFRTEILPPNMNVRLNDRDEKVAIEIRGTGQYVIAPPSPHISGNDYRVQNRVSIMRLENMTPLIEWLNHLRGTEMAQRNEEITEASKPEQMKLGLKVDRNKRQFLATVLSQEIARVETSPQGSRNKSLFYAALRLANYAAAKELDWSDCEMRLMAAAVSVGTPSEEARRTIASAWKIGSKNPKKVK